MVTEVGLDGIFLGLLRLWFATADTSSASGGDETNLFTGRSVTADSRRFADMLMITTTVGMFHGIHADTANNWPAIALGLVLVIGAASLQHWLVCTATTRDNTDHSPIAGWDNLLTSTRQTNTRATRLRVVRDDCRVITTGSSHTSTIASLLLDIADGRSFGQRRQRQNIADTDCRLLSAVHELSSVNSLGRDHQLLSCLVSKGITEMHNRQRGAASWVVNDLFNDTLDITVTFGKVDGSELGGPLAMLAVTFEDGTVSFTLRTETTTHFEVGIKWD
jgi:hypothetical protein